MAPCAFSQPQSKTLLDAPREALFQWQGLVLAWTPSPVVYSGDNTSAELLKIDYRDHRHFFRGFGKGVRFIQKATGCKHTALNGIMYGPIPVEPTTPGSAILLHVPHGHHDM